MKTQEQQPAQTFENPKRDGRQTAVHNFTSFHRKIMYKICGEKTTFQRLSCLLFRFFLDPDSQ